jgi:hypothetical protein
MIHHAFFFIDRYSKRWIIVGNDKTTSIDLLMSLSKVCVDYIWSSPYYGSRLRKVSRTLWLLNHSLVHMLHIFLTGLWNPRYVVGIIDPCRFFNCWVKPQLPSPLLRFSRSWPIVVETSLHSLHWVDCLLIERGSRYRCFGLLLIRPHCTCPTPNLVRVLFVLCGWHNPLLTLVKEWNPIHCVTSSSFLLGSWFTVLGILVGVVGLGILVLGWNLL